MSKLETLIRLKNQPCPVGYAGTVLLNDKSKALFPYPNHWRGDYRYAYPMNEPRLAGFRPRIDYAYATPLDIKFAFADKCFETAPYTQIPCFEKSDYAADRCVWRVDSQ